MAVGRIYSIPLQMQASDQADPGFDTLQIVFVVSLPARVEPVAKGPPLAPLLIVERLRGEPGWARSCFAEHRAP